VVQSGVVIVVGLAVATHCERELQIEFAAPVAAQDAVKSIGTSRSTSRQFVIPVDAMVSSNADHAEAAHPRWDVCEVFGVIDTSLTTVKSAAPAILVR